MFLPRDAHFSTLTLCWWFYDCCLHCFFCWWWLVTVSARDECHTSWYSEETLQALTKLTTLFFLCEDMILYDHLVHWLLSADVPTGSWQVCNHCAGLCKELEYSFKREISFLLLLSYSLVTLTLLLNPISFQVAQILVCQRCGGLYVRGALSTDNELRLIQFSTIEITVRMQM